MTETSTNNPWEGTSPETKRRRHSALLEHIKSDEYQVDPWETLIDVQNFLKERDMEVSIGQIRWDFAQLKIYKVPYIGQTGGRYTLGTVMLPSDYIEELRYRCKVDLHQIRMDSESRMALLLVTEGTAQAFEFLIRQCSLYIDLDGESPFSTVFAVVVGGPETVLVFGESSQSGKGFGEFVRELQGWMI